MAVINNLWIAGLCFPLPLFASSEAFVEFGAEHASGRQIWIDNCASCHGYGVAGAPIPMRPKHWEDRLTKKNNELYAHAINGFFGPQDTYMPPRGGNENLSDDDVRLAVDYMLALAKFYSQQKEDSR